MPQCCLCKTAEAFDDKLVVFSAPGLSSLLVFHDTAPSVFKLVDDNDDDGMIQNISKAIHRECKNHVDDKNKYTIWVDKQTGIKSVSAALISLLENLSDDPWFKLPSIVIGNITTSAVTNQPTPLQIGLGVTLSKKSHVQQFHDLGIGCSYDELLRFKASAAVATSNKTQLRGIQSSDMGLVQAITDYFDATITSPNGLKSTLALTLKMIQLCPNTGRRSGRCYNQKTTHSTMV